MALILVIATVIAILVALVFKLFIQKGPKAAKKSPFDVNSLEEPPPYEFDIKKREAVFKQTFSADKVPQYLDAILIGSGIGSLSTAALLSKCGWKVLVLEKHHDAGGCCHTFQEKGFEFDIGIHYIGNLSKDSQFRMYMDQLTDGKLQWVQTDHYFDEVKLHMPNKEVKSYPIGSGKEGFKESLMDKFPEEEAVIDKFIQLLHMGQRAGFGMFIVKMMPLWMAKFLVYTGLIGLFSKFFKLNTKTLKQVLDELTDNQELQAVLAYPFGDYGVLPSNAPFIMHSFLFTHYWRGAYYPKGGASEIAFHIIPVIERGGGRVLTRAEVTNIIVDDDTHKACGVTVVNRKDSNIEECIYAPVIISDAGVVNTFAKLLPQEIAQKSRYHKLIKQLGTGLSGFQLFVGLNASAEELGMKARNYWCYTDTNYEKMLVDYLKVPKDEVADHDVPLLFISFPSAKDPLYEKRFPGKSAVTVVTLTNYEWFAQWNNTRKGKRGDDYKTMKKQIGSKMWEQVIQYFPHLADKVEYMEVGSPLTHNHYIGSNKGEVYGLDHNLDRFSTEATLALRADTDIKGLYLTGQDIVTCGFAGAAYGGLLCASRVLERNLFMDLNNYKAPIKQKNKQQ